MNPKKTKKWLHDHLLLLTLNDKCSKNPFCCLGTNIGNGLVLTASHCISLAMNNIKVTDSDGKEYSDGEIKAFVNKNLITIQNKDIVRQFPFGLYADVGILYFPSLTGGGAEYTNAKILDPILIPSMVCSVSDRTKMFPVWSKGIVVGCEANGDYLWTDAYIVNGTSGAPIINEKCQIVGVAGQLLYGNWSGGCGAYTINRLLAFL